VNWWDQDRCAAVTARTGGGLGGGGATVTDLRILGGAGIIRCGHVLNRKQSVRTSSGGAVVCVLGEVFCLDGILKVK
jgi:hypothetical protein